MAHQRHRLVRSGFSRGRSRPALAAAFAVAFAIGGTATADATTAGLPFRASFSGTARPASATVTEFLGVGQATLVGLIRTDGTAVASGPADSCDGGVANVNTETLTGPSGDTITVESSDVACPIAFGVYAATGTWAVTGGTGRFAGSTGGGRLEGSADFIAGTFVIALDGTLQLNR